MFDAKEFIEEKVKWIQATVKDKIALVALSGGVDSSTTAILGCRALGEKIRCIFLDTGLMRQGEPEWVVDVFNRTLGIKVHLVNVSDKIFQALKGIEDPEEKRKAFSSTFYKCLGEVAKEAGAHFLIQGTNRADIEETTGGIKFQHNVLVQMGIDTLKSYGFKVIEPLISLYKDEIREVARALDLASEITERKPFPGPALACRVLGEVTPKEIDIVRKATAVVETQTKDIECFQVLAVLMKDRATGITKDGQRILGRIITIRCVQSKDALTADIVEIPWGILRDIEKQIRTEIPEVVQVLYSLTPKPPATIEFV